MWTHERAAIPQSIPQTLEALAVVSQYQRDEEIYPQEGPSSAGTGSSRRGEAVCPSSRRLATNRRSLAARRFLWFRGARQHAFTAEAIADDTVIARYPVSRMESLAASDAGAARELSGITSTGMSRLHSLLLIIGRTTPSRGRIFLAAHTRTRRKWHSGPHPLPVPSYDRANYLALSGRDVEPLGNRAQGA